MTKTFIYVKCFGLFPPIVDLSHPNPTTVEKVGKDHHMVLSQQEVLQLPPPGAVRRQERKLIAALLYYNLCACDTFLHYGNTKSNV